MTARSNPIAITLTQAAATSDEISIKESVSGRKLYISTSGFTGTEAAPTETIKFQQWVSTHTGWQDIKSPTDQGVVFTISSNGASPVIEFPSIAHMRIVGTGIVGIIEIKVDLTWE